MPLGYELPGKAGETQLTASQETCLDKMLVSPSVERSGARRVLISNTCAYKDPGFDGKAGVFCI